MYMSVSLLTYVVNRQDPSEEPSPHPKHDVLDDLESFYYVIWKLMHTRHGNGKGLIQNPHRTIVEKLRSFGENDPNVSLNAKKGHFLDEDMNDKFIPDTWLQESVDVLHDFHKAVRPLVVNKGRLVAIDSDINIIKLKALVADVENTYSAMISTLDRNIAGLKRRDPHDLQVPVETPEAEYESDEEEQSPREQEDETVDENRGTEDVFQRRVAGGSSYLSGIEEGDELDQEAGEGPQVGHSPAGIDSLPLPALCISPLPRPKRPIGCVERDDSEDDSPFRDLKRARTSSSSRDRTGAIGKRKKSSRPMGKGN